MTALDFANAHDLVVVRFAGNGAPTGQDVAWIPPHTSLPFNLDEVEGEVMKGKFTATNLKYGPGLRDWNFHDWKGNLISAIWLRVDRKVWQEQYDELMT